MKSHYQTIDGQRLHFLYEGLGPPIFLLHASPMSAASLMPLVSILSKTHTVIAIDTPGYGYSEEPPTQPAHVGIYADTLHKLQGQLGLEKVAIYGTATGAQIGIKYALDYPADVSYLFLDNSAHFTEAEKTDIYASYFPDLTPQEDGSHLRAVWDIVDHLFVYFPWCFQEEKYRLSTPKPPTSVLHRVALEYIKGGAHYDWAYRTAFAYEDRERIYELTVPTHIFRWEASILKPYTDRIFDKSLPANVDYSVISKESDRNLVMAQTINQHNLGPAVEVNFPVSEKVNEEIFEIPQSTFPSPEPTGQYLVEAWETINSHISTADLNIKTNAFIKWAESYL